MDRCHRANNGSYNPLERLARVRQVFFPNPGHTLGQHAVSATATARGYPENVAYERRRWAFAALQVVGSDNSLAPGHGALRPHRSNPLRFGAGPPQTSD
jgi:hypothetical protein